MPVDPVCGLEFDAELGIIHDHNGKHFIFVVMAAVKFSLKNPANIKIILKLEKLRTFYRILNF